MRRIRNLNSIVVIVLLVGMVSWLIYVTYQQTIAMNGLRVEAYGTLRSMYQFTNTSYNLLYNSEDLKESKNEWFNAYNEATSKLKKLINNNSLGFVNPEIVDDLLENFDFWKLNSAEIRDANVWLTKMLIKENFSKKENIRAIIIEVEGLIDEAKTSNNNELLRKLTDEYNTTVLINELIEGSTNNTLVFVIDKIEKNVSEIDYGIKKIIDFVIGISAILSFLLVLFFVGVIFSRQRILRKANLKLERQVKARSQSIRNLLDYSGEGFLFFGEDLIINPEHSKECYEIFGEEISGKNIANLLYKDKDSQKDFKEAMDLVFKKVSLPEVVFNIVDRKIKIGDKIIQIDFSIGELSNIMCKVVDVSENEYLQQELERENNFRNMCLRAVTLKRDFINLKSEAELFFLAVEKHIVQSIYHAKKEDNDEIIRKLHTFKANAGFLKMNQTEKSAQDLETTLIDYGILYDSAPVDDAFSIFKETFSKEYEAIVNVLGKDWDEEAVTVEVNLEKINDIKGYMKKKYPKDEESISSVDALVSLNLSNLFERLYDFAQDFAKKAGKRIDFKMESNNVYVSNELFNILSDVSINIIKNIIIHGIEFPGHRSKANKLLHGQVDIVAEQDEENLVIEYTDDGAGISIEKIKNKAIELNRIQEDSIKDEDDFIKMIFLPKFSTADTVTEVFGRGYGLSEVKESIYKFGGKIRVATTEGLGTKFTIIVPNFVIE